MSVPPREQKFGTDFRVPDSEITDEEAGRLKAILRDVYVRHLIVKEILEYYEDLSPWKFVNSINANHSVADTVKLLKHHLGVGETEFIGEQFSDPNELFSFLREKVEQLGIFVLLIGELGTHDTNTSVRVFHGFTFADSLAPFIVKNHHAASSAYSFTLIHELTHVFLGAEGVCGAPSIRNESTEPAEIERFCNEMAGEFLLPTKVVAEIGPLDDVERVLELVSNLATRASISKSIVLYRFWQCEIISNYVYSKIAEMYERQRIENRQDQEQSNESKTFDESCYALKQHKRGRPLIELVRRSLRADELTDRDAGKVLGVAPNHAETVLRMTMLPTSSK